MEKATIEKIQKWIKSSVKLMLAENNGAVYFYRIKGGASFVLAWIPYNTGLENKFNNGAYTIEASVRKTDSSYFVEDWLYIGEGITLQNADESNNFAAIVDWIFKIAYEYVKTEIYYMLPNGQRIELLSEMRTANYDFGDFEGTIEELRRTYYETTDEIEKEVIDQQIAAQCFAFADFLGIQYEEIQLMIRITDLSIEIKRALIPECAAVKHM